MIAATAAVLAAWALALSVHAVRGHATHRRALAFLTRRPVPGPLPAHHVHWLARPGEWRTASAITSAGFAGLCIISYPRYPAAVTITLAVLLPAWLLATWHSDRHHRHEEETSPS
jgi:hypothetical protein